jgi:uroporphyrin-III C-methyltransferase
MKKTIDKKGKVIFAGAGPGDPELLTIRALRWLQQAEVIITDRLVSEVIIQQYASKQALVLHAGKQRHRSASTPQQVISELLVDYALQGKLVVRLKGGDVSFFSNIFDELNALTKHGIAYEIVPGVTAASGAAAYAGIPLTARNYSNAVRFITCYSPGALDENCWNDLARTSDTLVFYMSSDNTLFIVEKLIAGQVSVDSHIAVIEQATTPWQQVYTANIYEYAKKYKMADYVSPTLLIIGKVAALHEQFRWMRNDGNSTADRRHYFSALGEKPENVARA